MPLVPFTPTAAEREQSIARDYLSSIGKLPDARSLHGSGNPPNGPPGSAWSKKQANAVRAIPIIDLDAARVVPREYFPSLDDQGFENLSRDIKEASYDDLKRLLPDLLEGNQFSALFQNLAELMTTNFSEDSINRSYQRNNSMSSEITEMSTSSQEENDEGPATSAIATIVSRALAKHPNSYFTLKGRNGPCFIYTSKQNRFRWIMAGVQYIAANDGSVVVNFPGSFSKSGRGSHVPVVSIECKPRNAGGLKRRSGEPETFSPLVFGQEVAQLIGAVMSQQRLMLQYEDQEAFVLCMHGTQLYLASAYFSKEYICYLNTGGYKEGENDDVILWVRRSIHYDLKEPDQRAMALELIWALITYLASGAARVSIIGAARSVVAEEQP